MPYFTFPVSVRYPQLSIDDLLSMDLGKEYQLLPIGKPGDTRTYFQSAVPPKLQSVTKKAARTYALAAFCSKYQDLYDVPRHSLYHSFSIPKRNGKWRKIDAPLEPLMVALRELKTIFETEFGASHHTSAFAYAQGRAAVSAVQRHQQNDSRWFLKLDCSNFFGSTTKDFTMRMLAQVWPFSEICEEASARPYLERAIDLAFLDGVLPQGTPLSPLLTNVIMIPFDHEVSNSLRDFGGNHLIYTRYADDLTISCRYDFKWTDVSKFIEQTFVKFDAPYLLNYEKTHYGSCAGRNWILGVMYNKDRQITLGKKRKDALRASIWEYAHSRGTDRAWGFSDLKSLDGTIAYFNSIEPAWTKALLDHYYAKLGFNVVSTLRYDIKKFTAGEPIHFTF